MSGMITATCWKTPAVFRGMTSSQQGFFQIGQGSRAAAKKRKAGANMTDELIRIYGFFVGVIISVAIVWLVLFTFFPSKPDGELWITVDGTRAKTTHYGHYEIQCLCEYLVESGYKCSDRFMGCGAVNCECFEYSIRLQNDLILWRTGHSGTFVQGEGLVCT
jgi:hypothetical protein